MSDKIINRQHQPFFMVANTFIDKGHLARIGASGSAVYLCLCRHANTEHQCFPSYSTLQKETGLGRATVAKAIASLIDLGYVRKLAAKRKQANIYEIMEFPAFTSSKTELVQKLNQFNNGTSTSSEIELLLVQKLNSKNTKGKRLTEKDSLKEESEEKTENLNPSPLAEKNEVNHPTRKKSHVKDPYARCAESVPLTAKQQAKTMIEEVCDWDKFFKARKAYLQNTEFYKNSNIAIVEGTVLKAYADILDRGNAFFSSEQDQAMAIAKVREMIQDHAKEYRLISLNSDTQQAHKDGLSSDLVSLVELHKKNPSEAQNHANKIEQSKGLPKNFIWNKVLQKL